jgi:hypothetical protein
MNNASLQQPVSASVQNTDSKAHRSTNIRKELYTAFGMGVIFAISFKLLLPSKEDQLIAQLTSNFSDSIFPAIIFPILVVSFVLSLFAFLIVKYVLKATMTFSDILVTALTAVFLALIIAYDQLIGAKFVVSLLLTFPLAQLVWIYFRRQALTKVIFAVLLIGLGLLSARILNKGSF